MKKKNVLKEEDELRILVVRDDGVMLCLLLPDGPTFMIKEADEPQGDFPTTA